MAHVDWICGLCGAIFQKPVGVPGRPQIFCSRTCRKKAARLRAGLRPITLENYESWSGAGLDPWTPDDAA
jgi:hypothetical protein